MRRAGVYGAHIGYYMNGLDEVVSGICAAEYREVYAPSAIFNPGDGQAFCYEEGADGAAPRGGELKRDILSALTQRTAGSAFVPVRLAVERVPHGGSMAQLKRRTARLSAYTTYFDGANVPRSANIKLAAGKISGCVLPAGATFSFNGAVGARTEKNGFKRAKIIEEGRFVYGTGGGVWVRDGYRLGRRYLTEKQRELLERLSAGLTSKDAEIMESILSQFTLEGGKRTAGK